MMAGNNKTNIFTSIKNFFGRTTNLLCIAAGILFIISIYALLNEFSSLFLNKDSFFKPGTSEVKEIDGFYVKEIVLESGSTLPNPEDYFDGSIDLSNLSDDISIEYFNMSKKKLEVNDFTVQVEEKYFVKGIQDIIVKLVAEGESYRASVSIQDHTTPEVTVRELTVIQGDEITPEKFIVSYIDNSSDENYNAVIVGEVDYSTPKTYPIKLSVCDNSGNCAHPETKLTVLEKIVEEEVKNDNSGGSSSNSTQTVGQKKGSGGSSGTGGGSSGGGSSSGGSSGGNTGGNTGNGNGSNNGSANNYNNAKNSEKSTDPAFWALVAEAKKYIEDNPELNNNVQNTFIQRSNKARAEKQVAPLTLDPELCILAQVRIFEYRDNNWNETSEFMHKRPDKRDFSTVFKDYGYVAGVYNNKERHYGENFVSVGRGNSHYSNDGAYQLLYQSPGHYANIVAEYYTKMGVAKGFNPVNGRMFWIQLFST